MESQLFALALQGSPQGQSLFVKKYARLLRAVVSRYLDQREDVEEVVQDAFMRIFRGLQHFRGECKLETWMTRVAISAALTRLRAGRNRGRLEICHAVMPEPAGGGEEPSRIEQREMHRYLAKALLHLQEKDRIVLQCFYLKEQSIREISSAYCWSEADVRSRLCRARKRLRTIIEARYQEILYH